MVVVGGEDLIICLEMVVMYEKVGLSMNISEKDGSDIISEI